MAEHQLPKLVTGVRFPSPALSAADRPNVGPVSEAPLPSCPCGLLVVAADELDGAGLCVVCSGSGHEWGCACGECALYFQGTDGGAAPPEALAEAIRVAGRRAGSRFR